MIKDLKIQRLANDGEGLAYLNNTPVYIYYGLPEEILKCEIKKNKRGALEGNIIDYLKTSNKRVAASCPYFTICGGCTLMHYNYFESLKYKEDKLRFLLKCEKINLDNVLIMPIKKSPDILGFRNNTNIKIQKINKNVVSGLYRKGTNQLFNMSYCPCQENKINSFYKAIIKETKLSKIPIYNKKEKTGSLYEIGIRKNIKEELMISFTLLKDIDILDFATLLIKKYPYIKSIYKIIKKDPEDRQNKNIKEIHLLGDRYLREYLEDSYFINLTPSSFFQLNYKQAMGLYKEILKNGDFKRDDVILDAYSGVSSISTYLSRYVKKCYSVEINKDATIAAKDAIKENNIKNIEVINNDFKSFAKKINGDVDKIIIDPPRIGLDDEIIKNIIKTNVNKIIYISCDLKTLARDLKGLNKYYKIDKIIPFDMFPMTAHVETVVVLSKKL